MKFIAICVLLHISGGLSQPDCAEDPGSCSARTASLMQLKSLQRKSDQSSTMRTKLAGFQKFTEKMIVRYGQPRDGVDSTDDDFNKTLEAVALVLDFIDNMTTFLYNMHYQDVKRGEKCEKIYDNCVAIHMTPELLNHSNISNLTDAAELAHETCRKDRAALTESDDKHCTDYDTLRTTGPAIPTCVGNKVPLAMNQNSFNDGLIMWKRSWNILVLGKQYTSPSWGSAAYQLGPLGQMEQCLVNSAGWLYPLWDLYQLCQRGGQGHCASMRATCAEKQKDFEQIHELYLDHKYTLCQRVDGCIKAENSSCDTICAGVAERAAAREADNETGMRLQCLLQVLFGRRDPSYATGFAPRLNATGREAALSACKDAVYDTAFWKITCPTDWMSNHPSLPIDCTCHPVSDSVDFQQEYYFNDPPALGPICKVNGQYDNDPDAVHEGVDYSDCCSNKKISKPWQAQTHEFCS